MIESKIFIFWGHISLLGDENQKEGLNKKQVDYIHALPLAKDEPGFCVKLSSESDPVELKISSRVRKFKKLEKWMLNLEGFDRDTYQQICSGQVKVAEQLLWERKEKTGTPYRHPYYGARVSTMFGIISVTRLNGYNQDIRKKEVDYVTVNSYSTEKPNAEYWVRLYSYKTQSVDITSRAKGFSKLEKWLYSLKGFERTAYEKAKAGAGEEPVVIWKKTPAPTGKILPDSGGRAFDRLNEGLWLQDRNILLPWGTFGELEKVPGVQKRKTTMPNPDYKKYTYTLFQPHILNGLVPDKLMVDSPAWGTSNEFNNDWPVTTFQADIIIGQSGKEDFSMIKEHISRFLGQPDEHSTKETDGDAALRAYWLINGVSIEIRTWKPSALDVFRRGCWLEIECTPDLILTRFYTDDYQQKVRLHDQLEYAVIDTELQVGGNYVTKKQLRYTPDCFKQFLSGRGSSLVWWDKKYGKLGFANYGYCHIYAYEDVKALRFTGNFFRDEPRGCSFYVVVEQTSSSEEIYVGTFNSLEEKKWLACRETLSRITQKPHRYWEDRQYY